jgi:protein-tyrosine phosphatase
VSLGKNLVIHCRAGIGRSSLIAAGVLITLGSDASVALAEIGRARGLRVPDTAEQDEWIKTFEPLPLEGFHAG